MATLHLNLTICQISFADQNICQQLSESILEFLKWANDSEATYRSYRALGNLLCTPYGPSTSALIVSVDSVTDRLRDNMSAVQPAGFEKINEIARDIINTL